MSVEETAPPQRLDYGTLAPEGVKTILQLQAYVNNHTGIDKTILELIKLRCSQINGCAYCVDLHTREAAEAGETQRRLHAVAVWRESPFFTTAERAALAWAEAVTLVSVDHVPDDVYEWVSKYFSGKALVDLTFAVLAINCWNRLAVGFRVATPLEVPRKAGKS